MWYEKSEKDFGKVGLIAMREDEFGRVWREGIYKLYKECKERAFVCKVWFEGVNKVTFLN